ncbi:MAG TPA: dockerin type I domain-containing protein [archaeon]|nr:dockerin type I domain-containing protein [archaeon]
MRKIILLFLAFLTLCSFSSPALSRTSSKVSAAYRGDINEDGRINIFDLLLLLRILSSKEPESDRQRRIANVDNSADSRVNVFDLLGMLKLLSGAEKPQTIVFSSSVAETWAVGDGEKVFRGDLNHRSKSSNSIWDGSTIRLKGLYNEVLAFQVIVVADSSGAAGVEVSVDPLTHSSSGKAISAYGTAAYGSGGGIELFSEHYIQVVRPTSPLWFYGSEASAPERMTGWIPDPLITPDALPGQGGFPLDIPPGQVQGFWVDLYLPRDRSYPAGAYKGMVRVLEQGWEVDSIPLELTLLPHYLPDENHSNVWLYHDSAEPYYPDLSPAQIESMLKHEAHRHRIDLVGGFRPHYSRFEKAMLDSYKPYLDGSAFTSTAGYEGPGQGEGEYIFPVGMYGSTVMEDSESDVRQQSDLWVNWFEANAPNARFFWYLIDEPGTDMFNWIRERSGWVHNNPGPGKRLPVFITREYTLLLSEEIDIWAGGQGVYTNMLSYLRNKGRDHWFYNGFRPRWGSTILEAEAVDLRMNAWAKYLYDVNTWFIWHGTHWRHNHQGPRAGQPQQVFTDPVTFISGPNSFGNGDGIVFYPGHDPFFPQEDRGVNRLLGSIKLKNIRRGQQDYEIMWLAEQKAGRDEVLKIVRSVVPKAFNDVDKKAAVPWSQRGDDYDQARARLLDLLE